MTNHKIIYSAILVFAILASGCGGGSSSSGTSGGTTSSGVTLSGTMESPSGTTSSYSALVGSATRIAYVEEAPADGVAVEVYNLTNPTDDGEPVAEGTTDSDGGFDIDCDPDLVDAGDMLLILGENGIALIHKLESDTAGSTIDTGEVDFSTTLSYQSFLDELEEAGIDISDIGAVNLGNADIDFDPECYLAMQDQQWENSDPTDDGLGANLALLHNLMAASMASGSYTEHGYETPGELMDDLMDGDCPDEVVAALAEEAETLFGGSAEVYTESYDYAVEDCQVINGVYTGVYAADDETPANVSAQETETEEDDLCAAMLEDADLLEQTMEVMMASDDIASFTASFGTEDAMNAYYEVMQMYAEDGDYVFESEGEDEATHDWDPSAFAAIFYGMYSQGGDDGVDPEVFMSMMDAMPEFDDSDSGEDFDYESWGAAMAGQYYDNPFEFDAEDCSGFWTVQVGQGFDATELDFEDYDFYEAFDDVAGDGDYDFDACIADPESCYETYAGDEFDIEGYEYEDMSSDATCGDGNCESGEEDDCQFDCGYDEEAAATYEDNSAVCGNDICEYNDYEMYSCPEDCPDYELGDSDSGDNDTEDTDDTDDTESYSMTCDECTTMCTTSGYPLAEGTTCADMCNSYYPGICE